MIGLKTMTLLRPASMFSAACVILMTVLPLPV
jgi:hypothetical protein